jgi:hypothetical protein
MESSPDLEAERAHGTRDGSGGPDGAGRPVERGQEAVPAVSISRPRNRPSCSRTTA